MSALRHLSGFATAMLRRSASARALRARGRVQRHARVSVVEALEQRQLLSTVVFTVNSGLSTATASGTSLGFALVAQAAGSLTTSYSGTVTVDVNPGSVRFISAVLTAANNGTWQPGGTAGCYAGNVVTPLGTVQGAARALVGSVTSGTLAVGGGGTFSSTGLTFSATSGRIDYNAPIVGSGTTSLTGNSVPNQAASSSTYVVSGGVATITIPVSISQDFALISAGDTHLVITGQVVATAPVSGGSPVMVVQGSAVTIGDGDSTPSTSDGTDFTNVNTANTTVLKTFVIKNTGSGALNLTGGTKVVVGGTNAGDFTVTQPAVSSIAAGGSASFDVTFNPSALGTRTATLSIANNTSGTNPYNFSIQGRGAPSSEVRSGVLYVYGTDLDDTIALSISGANTSVNFNGTPTSHSTSSFSSISISGGNGFDTISLLTGVKAASIGGGKNGDTITGGDFDDTVTGGKGNDSIKGGKGKDVISGGDGNDTIIGGGGADTVNGDAGDDSLTGGLGPDSMVGGLGNDIFRVRDGVADTVNGSDGTDTAQVDAIDLRSSIESLLA